MYTSKVLILSIVPKREIKSVGSECVYSAGDNMHSRDMGFMFPFRKYPIASSYKRSVNMQSPALMYNLSIGYSDVFSIDAPIENASAYFLVSKRISSFILSGKINIPVFVSISVLV
jgi:hypothetical protein